jgi:hypothetical protein
MTASPAGVQAGSAVETVINPVTLAFADPAQERAFREDWNLRALLPVRVATILGIAMYAGFGLLDVAVIPDHLATTWAIRFGLIIPLGLLFLAASFTGWFLRHLQLLTAALGAAGGLGIVAIIAMTGEAGQQAYHPGVLLIVAYIGMFTRLRFLPAVAATALVVITAAVILLGFSGQPPISVLNHLAFVAAVMVISLVAAYQAERTARVDFVRRRLIEEQAAHLSDALANVRELRGLIPICAWCNRIRDDDGYWQKLEAYLAPRSRAEFSHGMCPGCFAKYGAGLEDEAAGDPPEDTMAAQAAPTEASR